MKMYSSKGGTMNKGKGLYSTKGNPVSAPSKVKPQAGPGGNSDQSKVNKLLQKAQKQEDSLRGKSGM
jgi:hypothetical protein